MRKLLLLSSSTIHGSGYLEYARQNVLEFFTKNGVKDILFVPYANVESQQKYTDKIRSELGPWGFNIQGLNEVENPVEAVNNAQAIFVGGGNTFLLLKLLQENKLIEPIRRRVLQDSIPYMGSSAGTNVATYSINTTNDMPIVHCESFQALGLVPFNINPHYVDTDEKSTHMGETRETRIQEYHALTTTIPPVVALREGSFLQVMENVATLGGLYPSRIFFQGKAPEEYPSGTDVSFLL